MRHIVSVLVPAYNEERRVGKVLDILLNSSVVDEVICINDGSQDKTGDIIKSRKQVVCINLPTNHGKAYAIVQGLRKAKGSIVVFVDADLVGLSPEHLHKLIAPLQSGGYDVCIGYRSDLVDRMFMPFSGERAYFKKDLVPYNEILVSKGYGMELYLNYQFCTKRIKLFQLVGVWHMLKYDKQSHTVAIKGILQEMKDILKEIIGQKNPMQFFIQAYLYHFYVKPPKKK
jgi:glycosyltransferase involved in cell wall biosynthesis